LSSRNKRTLRVISALLISIAVVLTAGCGYSLKGKGSFLPDHIRTIALSDFENLTTQFELEKVIAEKMQEELLSRGSYKLVGSADEADASLTGIIIDYRTTPKSLDAEGRATSYSIKLIVSVKFTDLINKKVLFEDPNYSVTEEYQLTSSDEDFLDQEEFAIEEAVKTLAEALVGAILEGF
jgi:outer membrane lipopolysaccharide assembly protein LptE/RlpB